MRIGIFTDTYEPQINGVVTSIGILKKELINKGHEVFVFAPKIPGYFDATPNIYRLPSIPFILLPEHRVTWASPRLIPDFEKLKLDIIHSHTPFFMGRLAIKLSRKYKIPHIHTYHTFFEKYGHYILMPELVNHYITKYISRWFCHQAELVIAPSRDMKEILHTYDLKMPLVEIPTGIDSEDFPVRPDEKVLSRVGLGRGRQYLLYAGRLAEEKNLDFLLAAFVRVAPEFPQADLVFIGNGPRQEHLKQLAKKNNLSDRTIFTGYLPRHEVMHCYLAGKIFIFSSLTETQGMVILEAMTAGVPVVAIKAMGIDEIMSENAGGFLTDNNLEEFCQAIRSLLNDPHLWQKKSAGARHLAGHFSASNMVDEIIEHYRSLIK